MQKLLSRTLVRYGLLIMGAVALGIGAFEWLHISIFSRFGMPHTFCYLREPKMIWLQVTSDSLIGISYVSISLTLAYLVYKASKDIPFHWVFLAFGLFIVSCGFTHFMEVLVIWHPLYWLSGFVKVVTATASAATALALFPLVPKVFSLIDSVKRAEARRRQVEMLNCELDAFTSSVAHDLRSPLRAMAGLSAALQEDYGEKLDDTARDYMQRIATSAQKMDHLILDLLNYARVGSETLQMEPITLDSLIEEVRTLLSHEIDESKATIVVVQPLGTVLASRPLLSQAVSNVFANALKFTAPGTNPNVTISSEIKEAELLLRISDNGIGIPPEHRQRIFGMFERLNVGYPGTGIGLAIVQKAMQRMGGRVEVESHVGEGSTFTLILPQPAAPDK